VSIESTETPTTHCRNCGEEIGMSTGLKDGVRPTPGSFSLCLYCGHLSVYADDLTLREPTDEEVKAVAGNAEFRKASEIVDMWHREKT
jgi:hypothetical protein